MLQSTQVTGVYGYVATKVLVAIASLAVIALIVGGVLVFRGAGQQSGPTNGGSPSPAAAASGSPSANGLQVTDEVVGTGDEAVAGKTVSVNYVGTLMDGKKFDSSYDRNQPFEFQLGAGQVIKGWDQGVAGMKVGGKRKLVIPPELGYGSQGAGDSIPPNSTLVFEVELLGVK
jgi:FKBP-type peptidyl-prolyl cis-trans isomerase